jgi:hypothetical protein
MRKSNRRFSLIFFSVGFFANFYAHLLIAQIVPNAPSVKRTPEEPNRTWFYNATLKNSKTLTIEKLGAAQGASRHDGKIYLYGDDHQANPRCGVIREYDLDLKATGRMVWLRKHNRPLLIHPTGLTWDRKFGCFIGDTVAKKATIYKLDWPRALAEGTLDNSIQKIIDDDMAINGCRPAFVTIKEKTMLATADYGNARPCIRLYDVEKLQNAERSSAPGVVLHTILCGPFNQNLAWDAEQKHLVCIQNVTAGRGWQLDVLDLAKAIDDGRADGPNVRVKRYTLAPQTELEGYLPLDHRHALYITSSGKNNVAVGELQTVVPRESPPSKVNSVSPGREVP